MRLTLLASVLLLSACGAPAPYRQVALSMAPVDVAQRECRYEAEKATASMTNGFDAGWTQGTLIRQCMANKGFKR